MSDRHPEIVIVRRGGHGDHDEHHGGVWKIAFADFMTAMMAFFLVLWLISANDKTRASVARYFNPVRLVDATTQPRGLHDSKKDDSGITASPNTKDKASSEKKEEDKKPVPVATAPETPKGRNKRLDAELRDNPYVALAEIVGDKGPGESSPEDGAEADPAIGHGGAAFRDPFAPPPSSKPSSATDDVKEIDDASASASMKAVAAPSVPPTPAAASSAPSDKTEKTADANKMQKQADELKTLATALKDLDPASSGPLVNVQKTKEGTLLSLTDTDKFTMFANGSSVPSRRVILLMEKVARLLKDKPGMVVVRGFTDNKKFRSTRNDNWRLSLDRAQVAHYMLARGGLADARFSHVEGYADHAGTTSIDPASPHNRRIEILLKDSDS